MPNEQHFPAWPLITAVISHSPRAGAYTAKVELPHAPVQILKRPELPQLRRDVIAKVQQWTNDQWHKPVRLQVEDPDGRWVLGVPRGGPIVELDTIPPADPTALHAVSPGSRPPAGEPSARRPPRSSRSSTPPMLRPRLSSGHPRWPRVLAVGILSVVLAAGAYALASGGSAPVHARATARTARPGATVTHPTRVPRTPTASTVAPAATPTTATHPRRHPASGRRRRAVHAPRAPRRTAHSRSPRAVVSHGTPTATAKATPSNRSPSPPPVTTTTHPATSTPRPAAASSSHRRGRRGCVTTNCLPLPGNGPPPL